MNLKEAFRVQNILNSHIDTAMCHLNSTGDTMKTISTHKISEANPGAEDRVEDSTTKRNHEWNANDMLDILEELFSMKQELTRKIGEAKRKLPLDIDAELAINVCRRKIINGITPLISRQAFESKSSGTSYRINNDGNQVPFYYNIESVTTIDYDRTRVKAMKNRIAADGDAMSDKIEKLMLEAEIDFTLPFHIADNFDEVIDCFLSDRHTMSEE